MDIMIVGWVLCLVLAVLQFHIKKERFYVQDLRNHPVTRYEQKDRRGVTYEQEARPSELLVDWKTLRSGLRQ